jgi:precorrin-6B C5,15-methyltransferase / cobalt-precorrin-6B C5,C15-methyltransferase
MIQADKVYIVGVGADGLTGMTSRSREVVQNAELLFGSESVLRLVPEVDAIRIRIGSELQEVVEQVRSNLGRKRMVFIATGDPLFYGVARYLTDRLGKESFEVLPHLSSMQLAFARIKETWEEAYLTDLSARPFEDAIDRIRLTETVGLFTSEIYHPARIARELLSRGIDYFRCYVCENLGGRDERITQGTLTDIQSMQFDPLNVMILVRKEGVPDQPRSVAKLARFGNPDDVFAGTKPKTGLITQSEVRAIALARLDLKPGCIFWDVGAGSGSVAIEGAQLVEPGQVYAIEHDPADYNLLMTNLEMYSIKNVTPVYGSAPQSFRDLPSPDAIFIGGNGGEVARLLEASFVALKPGGRLVVNVATIEMLSATYDAMKRLAPGVTVLLVNLARSIEQMESLRFESVNPTFVLQLTRPRE